MTYMGYTMETSQIIHLLFALSLLLVTCQYCEGTQTQAVYTHWADENYPPFEFKDSNGNAAGFSVDLIKAVGEEMNFTVKSSAHPWSDVKSALTDHRIDLSGTMAYDVNRTDRFVFSAPVVTVRWFLYVPLNSSVTSLDQLHGKRIILAEGDIWEEKLKTQSFPADLVIVPDYCDQLHELSKGGADAAIINKITASYLMEQEEIQNIKPAGEALDRMDLCIAAHISDPGLINKVNEGLLTLSRNGKYEEISRRWFAPEQRQVEAEIYKTILLYVLVPILIIGLLIVFWIWSLRRLVRIRTRELQQYQDHLEELVKERTSDLAIAKDMAEEANRAKSVFLSSMSHELRTPLNAILGYTQILRRQANLTDTQKQQLDTVRSSGEHLLSLINDLLDLGKIESQKMELENAPFNLPAVIKEIYNITKVRAEESSMVLEYVAVTRLPEYVEGDGRKLKQILLNLLGNAMKYTYQGHLILKVEYGLNGPGLFRCEVSDTGTGILEEKQKEIFEQFMQLTQKKQTIQGAAIGLSIANQLVELMHGSLGLIHEPERGSTFYVEMALPPIAGDIDSRLKLETAVIGYQGERKKILVVDDNITNASVLVSALEPLGFEIYSVDNGREAVQRITEHRPDLILLDLVMPQMDGIEVVEEIRKHQDLDDILIIGISATLSGSERKEAFVAVCDDFLPKPISIDRLLEMIESHLKITWEYEQGGKGKSEPGGDEEKEDASTRIPPMNIIDEMEYLIKRGKFDSLEQMLEYLLNEDGSYASFCHQIRKYAVRYDDEGILTYFNMLRSE